MSNQELKTENIKQPKEKMRFWYYLKTIPWMLSYYFIMGAFFLGALTLLRWAGMALIYSTGKVAVTSGDFKFIFTSWQGWVIILLVVVVLFLAVTIQINGMLLLCDKAVRGQEIRVWKAILEAFRSVGRILNKDGLLISIYIAIAAPLTGIGFTLTQTAKLHIPDFIYSAIWDNPKYIAIYVASMAFLIFFGIRNLFVLPLLVIDRMPAKEAVRTAHKMMKEHWKHFFVRLIFFSVRLYIIIIVITMAASQYSYLVDNFRSDLELPQLESRFVMILGYSLIAMFVPILSQAVPGLQILEIVRLYTGYKEDRNVVIQQNGKRNWVFRLALVGMFAYLIVQSGVYAYMFDTAFPAEPDVAIIAHRLGGNLEPENSLAAWRRAREEGATGFETDIQRAKDGTYVLNHDATFQRTCGVDKLVQDMTWKQIKKLRIREYDGTPSNQHPPSLEELLDDVKEKSAGQEDNVHLYLELKGNTADIQMADDVVAMVREKGMLDQCTIISLKYNLVSYVKRNYDDIKTGYLYFFAYGDRTALDCDDLIMEEESATEAAISTIHAVNKSAIVWTVNNEASASSIMNGNCDGIISDYVIMCRVIKERLATRSDYDRFIDGVKF